MNPRRACPYRTAAKVPQARRIYLRLDSGPSGPRSLLQQDRARGGGHVEVTGDLGASPLKRLHPMRRVPAADMPPQADCACTHASAVIRISGTVRQFQDLRQAAGWFSRVFSRWQNRGGVPISPQQPGLSVSYGPARLYLGDYSMNAPSADWHEVAADKIESTIADKTVLYDDGNWQTFAADGTTLYVDRGHNTHGGWRVRDGQFESVWPPSTRWDGYRVDVTADGSQVRFVSPHGDEFGGRFGSAPIA